MRGISVFIYSVRQGLKSMRKNRMFTLASISTIAACLFLFGLFYFIVSNFEYMIQEVETSVGVTVFFDEGTSEEQIETIGEAIRYRDEVDHMEFISAEEAWKKFVEENFSDNPELIDSFGSDTRRISSALRTAGAAPPVLRSVPLRRFASILGRTSAGAGAPCT